MCLCDQSLVTVAFLWEKLSQPQFYKDLTRKTAFFEGWSWFKFNNLRLVLGTNLKFYTSVAKGLKLKVRKVLGADFYVCRSYRGKTGRWGFFFPTLILNRVRNKLRHIFLLLKILGKLRILNCHCWEMSRFPSKF